jgi:hypothetical protein
MPEMLNDFQTIAFDKFKDYLQVVKSEQDPHVQLFVTMLEKWDGTLSAESPAAAVFQAVKIVILG